MTPAERTKKWRLDNPARAKAGEHARYLRDKPDRLKRCREWRAAHPEGRWAQDLRKKYGLTPELWRAIFEAQGSVCAICHSSDPGQGRRWATDHNHATGKVRGILCHSCNLALGGFQDSADHCREAARYLERAR